MNQNESINRYLDVYWSRVTTLELVRAIDKAIDKNLCGLYHSVYKSKISKYDLLNIIKKEFEKDINIIPFNNRIFDKSMVNTKIDFDFKVSDYKCMIKDMKRWMIQHKDTYNYYF
jgi:dTDP-4-dehydrorhamnose reductase